MIYLNAAIGGIVDPATAHRAFDASLDNVPISPSIVLLTTFLACVHIPSWANAGSASLCRPFIKVFKLF